MKKLDSDQGGSHDLAIGTDKEFRISHAVDTALAKAGIIALIDEATGYQYERPVDGLVKIFSKLIDGGLGAELELGRLVFIQQRSRSTISQ